MPDSSVVGELGKEVFPGWVGRQREGSKRFKLRSWDDWVGSYALNRQVKLKF